LFAIRQFGEKTMTAPKRQLRDHVMKPVLSTGASLSVRATAGVLPALALFTGLVAGGASPARADLLTNGTFATGNFTD
jgi:hypothetical protein